MGFFKKNDEVLDLTLLQKKGILKKAMQQDEEPNYGKTIDLTQSPSTPGQSPASSNSPFDFLDTLAQSNQSNSQTQLNNSEDLQHLKIKFEDIEYKMERLIEKLARIESKLESLEK